MEWSPDFDSVSPIDYRYGNPELKEYLSENASMRYKMKVETALVQALCRRGVCSEEVVKEVKAACEHITTEEVYAEERRIGHDIRALVNCIRAHVSDGAKPYVHMTATSYDIIDSANAARYQDAIARVLIPSLIDLEKALIDIALCEADTVQIGRTHGQHAVPITFGFAIAGFVSRLGMSIQMLEYLVSGLVGKFSGAVGACNALSLFFEDPKEFESEVLDELDLAAAEHSTQIVPPEALVRIFSEMITAAGIMANLSDDMRNLQRTEIGEVGEEFGKDQIGSSTMPQKRNPINFENAKSLWKVVMPRMITMYMDQISEHQRDLTNSASGRTYGEMIDYTVSIAKRLTRTMKKLVVDTPSMRRNLGSQQDMILAEPLQLILGHLGHPDAHEKIKALCAMARREERTLAELLMYDTELEPYLARMTPRQREILNNPSHYTGIAAKEARMIAERWKREFGD